MTQKEFIEKAKKVHGDKYDYSKVNYVGCMEDVIIICPEHGEFKQKPYLHISNRGCKECGKKRTQEKLTLTIEEISEKSNKLYGDKYDIVSRDEKNVNFICKYHGEKAKRLFPFLQGCGCDECSNKSRKEKLSDTKENFILKARQVHGWKYDYSKVEYINSKTKVCIICPEHGEFKMTPNSHLNGQNCPKCGNLYKGLNKKLTREQFIKNAKEAHGDRYDYSKVIYKNNHTNVTIICPEHGEFKQTPTKHVDSNHGCPYCSMRKFERDIRIFLEKSNIKYEIEKKFKWCGNKRFDFYLPDYNTLIECHGRQHFEPKNFFGGESGLKSTIKNDFIKNVRSKENGMNIIYYIPYYKELDNSAIPEFYKNSKIITKTTNLMLYLKNKRVS